MNMSPLEQFIRIITTISIVFSMVQPTLVYGRELDYPPSQEATATATVEATATATEEATTEATVTETAEVQATETETAEATATETTAAQATETATIESTATTIPTESPTVAVSETATVEATARVTPTETATLEATVSVTPTETATLEATATITATETATVEATASITPTKTATLEATATITAATPTQTATPIPLELKLRMNTTPAFVEAGQLVTVSVTLSNSNQAEMSGLQLQAPLPAGIIYLQGDLKHNPLLNLLVWDIPNSTEAEIEISYQLQIAANSPASALNLGVEIVGSDQNVVAQSQSSLIITALPTPQATTEAIVQPSIRQRESGPAASLKLKAAHPSLVADGANRSAVVIWVADAEGRPVAEGTEVTIKVSKAGLLKVKRERVQTKNGLAVVRLQAGEQVGKVQLEAQVNGLSAKTEISLIKAKKERLNQEALEISRQEIAKIGRELRHSLRPVGNHLEAEDEYYQAVLAQDGQIQVKNKTNQGETAALSLKLKRVQVGQNVLYNESQRAMKSEGNRVNYSNNYFSEEYQALSGGLEQFFIFKRPLPTPGDLVITLEVDTKLQGQRLSNRQGIAFYPPQGKRGQSDPGLLIYSGALVRDNDGREMYAKMGFKNSKIRLTVPEAWLAEAEYPLVIDPLIGDPNFIINPQGGASAADMAYNSSDNKYFLVWQETGLGSESEVYARHIAADGSLDESQISLSSMGGNQSQPVVAYNSTNNDYLVVWYDHSNHQIHGRRFDNTGTSIGNDFALSAISSSGQYQPALVYNPSSNSYLLAYSSYNISSGLDEVVYVQTLNSDGSLNGAALAVGPSGSEQSQPAVAHSNDSNEYLITWQDNRNGNYDIYAQVLDSSGQLSGAEISISTNSAAQDIPQVAYISNGGSGQYLVIWRQHVSDGTYKPYAQRLNSDGSLLGSSFTIVGNISGSRGYFDLTSNGNDKYLAVWDLDDEGEGDIKARLITSSGSKNSTKGIATDNNDQKFPAVAYNSSASQYLIAWEDSRIGNGSIYGRLRNSSLGSVSSAAVLSRIQREYHSPAISANPTNSTDQAFFAVWEEDKDGTDDIYGQWLNQNGEATGAKIGIDLSSADEDDPRVAYNTNGQQALVVWHSDQAGNDDIYAQRLDSNGLRGSALVVSNASGNQRYPEVAANSQDGSWLTVWAYNGQAYGRLVNSDGTLGTEEIFASNALEVAISYNPTANEYLLAWGGGTTAMTIFMFSVLVPRVNYWGLPNR